MVEATDKIEETFEEKLARTQGVDQDFASILVENWQRVLGSFLAVLLGVWVYGEYKSANESKVGEASKRFALVQENLDKIKTSSDDKEQLAKLVSDNITALKTTYDGTSYSELAPLYEALSLYAQGNLEQAEAKFRASFQLKSVKEFSRSDLVAELSGLALVRVLVDQQKESEALQVIDNLLRNAKVVNLEALLIQARISDDKSKLEVAAKQLKESRPELAEQINAELIKYGLNLSK